MRVGLSHQQSSYSLNVSFQNGYLNWLTTFLVIVIVRFAVRARAPICAVQLFTPSRGKTSYLFLRSAKRLVVNLHPKLHRLGEREAPTVQIQKGPNTAPIKLSSNPSALQWLTINGLSPTLSIMRAGVNIDWWEAIMEWLIMCSHSGFGPINGAQSEIETLHYHFHTFPPSLSPFSSLPFWSRLAIAVPKGNSPR